MQQEAPKINDDLNKSEDSSVNDNQTDDNLKPDDLIKSTSDMTFAEIKKNTLSNKYSQNILSPLQMP